MSLTTPPWYNKMYNISIEENENFYRQAQDARYCYSGFWEAEVKEKGILLVCSDFIIRNYLRNFISHFNRPVCTPSNPDRFIEELEDIKSSVSIVVYDLPVASPHVFECLENLKAVGDAIQVVLLASQLQLPQLANLLDSTSWCIVTKPIFPQQLKASIQEALMKKRSTTVSIAKIVEARIPDKPEKGSCYHPQLLLGTSRHMDEVKMIIDQVAGTDATILIRGESGTGKELVAKTIYECSKYAGESHAGKSFVTVLCPAIPEGLLESELFGHEKGSFTGAFRRSPGKFEIANHGTIFLDEIGDIPFGLQSKLLHVLQGGKFSRIGGSEVKVDVRIIAATNKELERSVSEGTFREDLYYRLNVVAIYLPPLRERKDDIPLFAELFLKKYNEQFNKKYHRITLSTIQRLIDYNWPGNVRELENLIKRIVIIGDEEIVLKQYMSEENGKMGLRLAVDPAITGRPLNGDSLEAREAQRLLSFQPLKMVAKEAQKKAEAEVILRALEWTRWNRKEAARLLKISYKALLYKIRQCNLEEQEGFVGSPPVTPVHIPLCYSGNDQLVSNEEA